MGLTVCMLTSSGVKPRPSSISHAAVAVGNMLPVAMIARPSVQEMMSAHPQAFTHLICAADFHLDTPSEIALVGRRGSADIDSLLRVVRRRFAPNEIVALLDPNQPDSVTRGINLPLLDGKQLINGAAAAYVCRDYACATPVGDADELSRLLTGGEEARLDG